MDIAAAHQYCNECHRLLLTVSMREGVYRAAQQIHHNRKAYETMLIQSGERLAEAWKVFYEHQQSKH